jgi:outer membrane receptor for ferric coprogen and ferric-rhodotorulic acid
MNLNALLGAIVAALSLPALGAERNCQLDTPGGPLDDALQDVSRQCSVQLLYFSGISSGKIAPKLHGEYPIEEALRLLLENAGLTFRPVNATTLEVTRAANRRAPRESASESGLAEVVIQGTAKDLVATRAETPLREIPQSLSIISNEQMRQQNHATLLDALEDAVGISISRQDSLFRYFYSRGCAITSDTVDGIGGLRAPNQPPFLPVILLAPELGEFDLIEVLRGSNALFGADTLPGAAVNLIRKRPLREPAAMFAVSAGSWNTYRQEADITGPLAQDGALRGRLVVSNASKDYFYKYAHDERQSVFGVLDYDLTEDTLVSMGGSYSKSHSRPFELGLAALNDGSDAHLSRATSYTFDWSRFDARIAEAFVRLEQGLGGNTRLKISATFIDNSVTYLIGYRTGSINRATGQIPRAGAQYSLEPFTQAQINAEATLTGAGQWGNRPVEWALGADYLRTDSSGLSALANVGDALDAYQFDPSAYPYPITNGKPVRVASPTSTEVTTRLAGAFASLRIHLTQPWSVTPGLRLSNEHVVDYTVDYLSGRAYPYLVTYKYHSVVTPYLGTLFTLNRTWSLYASYADIFANNNGQVRRDGSALPPREGVTIEGGVKGVWRDGALNGSLALYKIVQRGIPLLDTGVPAVGVCCYTSGGRNRSEGVDLEVSGHLAPQWLIGGGYTFNQRWAEDTGSMDQGMAENAPRHLLKLWTDYGLPGALNRWSIGGTLHAQSSVVLGSRITQKSFAVINPRVGYALGEHWRLALTINNLLDKRYYDSIGLLWYGEPRSYFARLDARF